MATVLGLHGHPDFGHDGGVALIRDGSVLISVEEERVSRRKRARKTLPSSALLEALGCTRIDLAAVDAIAYPWQPKLFGESDHGFASLIQTWLAETCEVPRHVVPPVVFVDHHVAHSGVGLAYAGNPKKAAIMVIDGRGECCSGGAYVTQEGYLEKLYSVDMLGSLGLYYEALTQCVGFTWGEEGKTMGLASYGRDLGTLSEIPDRRIEADVAPASSRANSKAQYNAERARLLQRIRSAFGDCDTFMQRSHLAATGEARVLERVSGWIDELLTSTSGLSTLVVSGGVALNCSINSTLGRLAARRGVDLVIPPPAGDSGIALGAACVVAALMGEPPTARDAYLGRAFTRAEIEHALRAAGAQVTDVTAGDIARRLAAGEVGGWFDGAAEAGPRALGRRSIIAVPDSEALRDKINFLKGRESWRPLAPSLTRREFDASCDGIPNAHMLTTVIIKESEKKRFLGVRHVDGSARPQVVDDADSSGFGSVLREMGAVTGTEAVTCTSFNAAGEPIVHTPEDALVSAGRMGLDFLAGEGWAVSLGGAPR